MTNIKAAMKTKSNAELLFIVKDATTAMLVNPQSVNNARYKDEVYFASREYESRCDGFGAWMAEQNWLAA